MAGCWRTLAPQDDDTLQQCMVTVHGGRAWLQCILPLLLSCSVYLSVSLSGSVRDSPYVILLLLMQHTPSGRRWVAVQAVYGKQCLIHWEDFGPTNARVLLEKYRTQGPTFNDDIQSTAAVVLACVLGAARRASVPPLRQQVFVFAGAGQASLGSAALLVSALVDEVRSSNTPHF